MLTAGQDGFRDTSSKQPDDLLQANGSHGLSRTSDLSILPSAPLAAPARSAWRGRGRSISTRRRLPPHAIWLPRLRHSSRPSPSASRRCGQSCWLAPPPRASAACAPAAPAARATDSPGRASPAGSPRLLPSTSTLRSLSSPARVILPSRSCRRWNDLSGSTRSRPRSAARKGTRADRASSSPAPWRRSARSPDLCQAPAVSVGTMPGHQPGLDLLQFDLQCAYSLALHRKQLARQYRQALRPARCCSQQRLDLVVAPWRQSDRTPPHSRGSHCSAAFAGPSAAHACPPASAPPAARRSSPARTASSAGSSPRTVPRLAPVILVALD